MPYRTAAEAYRRSLLAFGSGRIAVLAVLMAAGAVSEGVGIVLLVPLANLAFGWSAQSGWLGQIGLPLAVRWGMPVALGALLAGFVALVSLRAVVVRRRDIGLLALSFELVDGWRGRMVAALVRAEWAQVRALDRGAIEFAVLEDVNRLAVGSDRLLQGAMALVQLAILIGAAFWLSPPLTLIAVLLLVLALPLVLAMVRAGTVQGAALTKGGSRRHSVFTDIMAGMKLAKAHAAEERNIAEFRALSEGLRERTLEHAARQARGSARFQTAAAALAALLLWIGTVVVPLAPAVLSAVLVLFSRLPGPALRLAQGAQSLAMILPAIENLLTLEASLSSTAVDKVAPAEPLPAGSVIALEGVTVRHGEAAPVLDGLDLVLRPGELVALIGPSGSGKTTLGDVLIGLVAPQAGALCVGGRRLEEPAARAGWRRQVGYVPQEPFLFDRTIAENLRWAAPEADDAALWAALESADAAGFVRALPDGLATRVGDRGNRFSGGERQRLCLARALLRRPALLVLDEATSELDPASEQRLLAALHGLRGDMTILVIAHRLPPDFAPDRVLQLEQGRLAG